MVESAEKGRSGCQDGYRHEQMRCGETIAYSSVTCMGIKSSV